jgi:hypothetical protein
MKLIFTMSFFCISFSFFSQVKISGYLLDAKKLPIPGGSVAIKNAYDGATSNEKGYFEFTTGKR